MAKSRNPPRPNRAATSQRRIASEVLATAGISRVAGLVIINAMMFQEVLSSFDSQVQGLRALLRDIGSGSVADALANHWQFISNNIDYTPIFDVAINLITELPSDEEIEERLRDLTTTARSIVSRKAALRQDLMGRIFHRMLLEAKYLGTYYTSIPAATILLRTALRPDFWPDIKWDDPGDLANFKVADLACGTGTLLMAAADAISDNSLHALFDRSDSAESIQSHNERIHRVLAEQIIHGYDVLATALHLTAATLAMRAPDVVFQKMNMFAMPLGEQFNRLGTLDFITSNQLSFDDTFGASITRVSGKGDHATPNAFLPKVHLCAINPPFTRSVGGNLLFGSMPKSRRPSMQKRLKRVVAENNIQANITAGLGSVFVALATRDIINGGRLALVLPKAVLNGSAWELTRGLLARRFHLEFVFSSHDPARWNFSDSTDLSEVMLVAQKLPERSTHVGKQTTFVNFLRNPTTMIEALGVTYQLKQIAAADLKAESGIARITIGDVVFAEVVSLPWKKLAADQSFFVGTAFAQTDLVRVLLNLQSSCLILPGSKQETSLHLTTLGSLGVLGPDRRDIHDGFTFTTSATAYPTLWGRDADENRRLLMTTNGFLSPLTKAKKGRKLRKTSALWPLASNLMLSERIWLVTQSVMAVVLETDALANVWWPFRLNKHSVDRVKALALWLNSTLGLILLLGSRIETRGAWISFKKPTLKTLPVIDLDQLSAKQLGRLSRAFDDLSETELLPFAQMQNDPGRAKIDDVWQETLELPNLGKLRELLGREPVVGHQRL